MILNGYSHLPQLSAFLSSLVIDAGWSYEALGHQWWSQWKWRESGRLDSQGCQRGLALRIVRSWDDSSKPPRVEVTPPSGVGRRWWYYHYPQRWRQQGWRRVSGTHSSAVGSGSPDREVRLPQTCSVHHTPWCMTGTWCWNQKRLQDLQETSHHCWVGKITTECRKAQGLSFSEPRCSFKAELLWTTVNPEYFVRIIFSSISYVAASVPKYNARKKFRASHRIRSGQQLYEHFMRRKVRGPQHTKN